MGEWNMNADHRIIEWNEDKVMEQIHHFKAVVIMWECIKTEEGTCKFKYSYSIERRLKKCKRNMGNLNGTAGKWLWGIVGAVAVVGAAVATVATGGLFLGASAAIWAGIAAFSGAMVAVSSAGEAFNKKYEHCEDMKSPPSENESNEVDSSDSKCNAFCTQQLAKLWAKIGKKD
jgi:hypothetical protein